MYCYQSVLRFDLFSLSKLSDQLNSYHSIRSLRFHHLSFGWDCWKCIMNILLIRKWHRDFFPKRSKPVCQHRIPIWILINKLKTTHICTVKDEKAESIQITLGLRPLILICIHFIFNVTSIKAKD